MPSLIHYIAHLDMDSFFVAVELLKAPELKGKPVIVGGHLERGIVTTCSYEARKFGVHSAMAMKMAIRLCPQAIIIPGNYAEYVKASKFVSEIISSKAPLFEKASIDEFYIDLSGMDKYFDPLTWMINLRELITQETGLPLSFGIGNNKMVAKMATNEAKPNGFLQVPPGSEKEFLAPLEVEKIPGVGPQMEQILKYHQFHLIRDIQKSNQDKLQQIFGKSGIDLWNKANGLGTSVINPERDQKSVSKENTFDSDIADVPFLMSEIVRMSEQIAFELRKNETAAGCITIKIKYSNFEVVTRQISIAHTAAEDEIIPVAKALFEQLYKNKQAVRLLGVRASNLSKGSIQTNLFQDTGNKSNLYKAIDEVKNKFGGNAVFRASGK
ncbi:MAG: DNA polymerase IV [Ginsengibacter sp.]